MSEKIHCRGRRCVLSTRIWTVNEWMTVVGIGIVGRRSVISIRIHAAGENRSRTIGGPSVYRADLRSTLANVEREINSDPKFKLCRTIFDVDREVDDFVKLEARDDVAARGDIMGMRSVRRCHIHERVLTAMPPFSPDMKPQLLRAWEES